MERKNKKWYETIGSSASAKTPKVFTTVLKNRLGKSESEIIVMGKRNKARFSENNAELIANAGTIHRTRWSDKYDSVLNQSTGHLKDF